MSAIDDLLLLMATLRHPEKGCPWDVRQTFASIAPYTLEEAYEVLDSIEKSDWKSLQGELGDLLFQVVFHAQMAKEQGLFSFDDVVSGIVTKMTSRHPHVFGDENIQTAEDQSRRWEELKHQEKLQSLSQGDAIPSVLDGIANALPALVRAEKIQSRAAKQGMDWQSTEPVVAKLHEELQELEQALADSDGTEAVADELGDLLFTCVNVARHQKLDAEAVLRRATQKFEQRFRRLEAIFRQSNREMAAAGPEELDRVWNQIKKES